MSVSLFTPSVGYKPTLDYFGGLFDGEGSVTITHRFKDNSEQFYVALSLSNTDIRVLELLKEIAGGSIHTQKLGVNYINYNWYVSHKSARAAIDLLLPYTIIKTEELLVAAKFYDDMKPLGYAQRTAARWKKDTSTIHSERLSIYEQCKSSLRQARQENRVIHSVQGLQTF